MVVTGLSCACAVWCTHREIRERRRKTCASGTGKRKEGREEGGDGGRRERGRETPPSSLSVCRRLSRDCTGPLLPHNKGILQGSYRGSTGGLQGPTGGPYRGYNMVVLQGIPQDPTGSTGVLQGSTWWMRGRKRWWRVTVTLTSDLQMASNESRLQQPPPQKDAADQNFDFMFKLLIIGNSSVGKTSFLFRYADDSFTSAFVSTVGIDFKVKTVFRNDKRIKLQIWDTAGQERYRTITTAYYRGAMGFLLMYDITNQESFNAVQDWATQIKTYSWDNAQVILVGNKCDLEDDRIVPTEDSQRLAEDLGFQFFEASAKDNINVKQVFERLVDIICEKMNESLEGDSGLVGNHRGQPLQAGPAESKGGCAC
ncbi:Ras-related protein Rab-3D [Merluccius polli]|uniref:Ras-related protein Rab-3 n=2 Tax=Merluccius polli TaxID=89951 RepID=A0AA47P0P7_MERPO|nr:Ras-related protein Rab-3D [Merluccius polli]